MKSRLAVLGLSFLGMVETLYLSLQRNSGPVPCSITTGCGDVLGSVYSEVAGIPISSLGFLFYITVFGATVFDLFGGIPAFRLLRIPAAMALLVSAVLTGIQAFVLEAYCEYCLASATLSTTICILVWAGSRRSRGDAESTGAADEADFTEKV